MQIHPLLRSTHSNTFLKKQTAKRPPPTGPRNVTPDIRSRAIGESQANLALVPERS